MALTKTERKALELLRARLDCNHPGHRTDCIKGQPVQCYLDTWALPLLDYLLQPEDRRTGDADLFINRPWLTLQCVTGQKEGK